MPDTFLSACIYAIYKIDLTLSDWNKVFIRSICFNREILMEAYSHAPIKFDVYVKQPPGYQQLNCNKLVWNLNKSLNGL